MRFLVLDGLDGCGKDTQAKFIAKYLINKNKKVIIRSHPSKDNFFGKKARKYLQKKGKKAHILSAFFYTIDVLRSILLFYRPKHEVIIFVRYLMGTAYLPRPLVNPLYLFFSRILPNPYMSILIDINPHIARKRILQRKEIEEMFETNEKLKKMRAKMLFLAKNHNWLVVNGNGTQVETWNSIQAVLSKTKN